MSGHVKTADGWKAMTKIPARIDTGLEEVVSGWHKMDTGWVRIWSSGAMIEFLDYPYPIPVMAGWEYSEDGVTWTKAEEDRDLYVPSAGEYMDFTNATASWAIDSADGGHYVKFSGITRVQTTYSHYKAYFTARRTDGTEFEFSDSFNINTNYGSTLSNIDTSFLKVNKFEVTDGWDGEIVETFIPADAYKFTGFVKTKGMLTLNSYSNEDSGAKIPVTEGSTYTLNGQSGTASVSEVLTFESKVTGTIKYVAGDLLPGIQITVTDDSGNVIEGAEITIEEYSDWDLSGVTINIVSPGAESIVGAIGSEPYDVTFRFHSASKGLEFSAYPGEWSDYTYPSGERTITVQSIISGGIYPIYSMRGASDRTLEVISSSGKILTSLVGWSWYD